MINKNKVIVLLAALLFVSTGYAQRNWQAEVYGGWNYLTLNESFVNWGNTWQAGMGASCQVKPGIQMVVKTKYHHSPAETDKIFILVLDVYGWDYRLESENSYAVETSVALRFLNPEDKFGMYATLGGGLYFMRIGKIEVFSGLGEELTESYLCEGTGMNTTKPFGYIGCGFNIPISSRVRLKIESVYNGTFDGKLQYLPVVSTFQFAL